MDQYTRRIIGFGVHVGVVDGVALCRIFNQAIRGHQGMPKYLSSDHDPIWAMASQSANPGGSRNQNSAICSPVSSVERLIGTIRREYLDRTLFWTTIDLENKLLEFRDYFTSHRTHHSLGGRTPDQDGRGPRPIANLNSYRWQAHCRGLYETPIAA